MPGPGEDPFFTVTLAAGDPGKVDSVSRFVSSQISALNDVSLPRHTSSHMSGLSNGPHLIHCQGNHSFELFFLFFIFYFFFFLFFFFLGGGEGLLSGYHFVNVKESVL